MNRYLPIIVGGVILLGLIVFFTQNQPRYYNWRKEFAEKGKKPYDVKVLHEMLKTRFEVEDLKDRVEKELLRKKEEAKNPPSASILFFRQTEKKKAVVPSGYNNR